MFKYHPFTLNIIVDENHAVIEIAFRLGGSGFDTRGRFSM
jgi:hypothetical protein